jgi:hypothetical protein
MTKSEQEDRAAVPRMRRSSGASPHLVDASRDGILIFSHVFSVTRKTYIRRKDIKMKKTEKMKNYKKQLETVATQLKSIPLEDLDQVTGGTSQVVEPGTIKAVCW